MRVTPQQYDGRWQRLERGGRESKLVRAGPPRSQIQFAYQQYNRFLTDRLTGHFGKVDGLSILEVGCGRGTTSMSLALGHQVRSTLLDFSHPAVALARRNFEEEGLRATFVQGDVFHLPFEGSAFDVVCSIGLLEHFADLDTILREALRVLRPGGMHISLNAPRTPPHLLDPVERVYTRLAVMAGRVWGGLRRFAWRKLSRAGLIFEPIPPNSGVARFRSDVTPAEYRRAAERAGFVDVHTAPVNPFPVFRPAAPPLDAGIARAYGAILAARHALGIEEPFVTTERRGRTHFLWGVRP